MMRYVMAAGLVAAMASSAAAEEAYFRTPSGNIFCGYMDYDGLPSVRCDISEYTPSFAKRPADCDLDWGGAFEVAEDGRRGAVLCHGDTVMSPDARVLPYGKSFMRNGITCVSQTKGLTCENSAGHGFFVSKATQRVF